jgi:hypothetical protein
VMSERAENACGGEAASDELHARSLAPLEKRQGLA